VSQRVTLEQGTLRAASWHFCWLLAQSELCNDSLFCHWSTGVQCKSQGSEA